MKKIQLSDIKKLSGGRAFGRPPDPPAESR